MADDCCKQIVLNVRTSDTRYGTHVSIGNNLYNTIKKYSDLKCVQLFLGVPTTLNCRTISSQDKELTFQYCKDNNKSFYVHCPYVTNLARKDSYGNQSRNLLAKELDTVTGGPAACVLHVGKAGNDGTLETIGANINQLIAENKLVASTSDKVPFHLLLEIAAGQKNELGTNWEELRKLYESIDKTRVGLCIDTQHAFASGMCNFSNHEEVIKLYDAANAIANKGISLIHLNDSNKEFSSHVDRHAPLKQGFIWYHEENQEGLKSLLELSKDIGYDLISETSDAESDFKIIKEYI